MEFIENIDELKQKYEYKIGNIEDTDLICSHLGFLCYYGICCLLTEINLLIEKLRLYSGEKKNISVQYIKEMNQLYNKYNNLKEEVNEYYRYYINLIRDIQGNLRRKPEVKNIKEFSAKAIKEILDSNVEVYINHDKKIINILNKIKDIYLIFNF